MDNNKSIKQHELKVDDNINTSIEPEIWQIKLKIDYNNIVEQKTLEKKETMAQVREGVITQIIM